MKQKKKVHPQVDEKKVDDLLKVTAKISELSLDKQMYIAGAIAALSADITPNSISNGTAR